MSLNKLLTGQMLSLVIYCFAFAVVFLLCNASTITTTVELLPFYNAYNEAVNEPDISRKINLYNYAISGKYDFPEAHQNLAILYDVLGQSELASHHHRAACTSQVATNNFRALCYCNLVTFQFGKLATRNIDGIRPLLDMLKEARRLDPTCSNVLLTTAFMYIGIGHHNDAIIPLVSMLELEPSNVLGLLNIGNHYFYKSNFKIAILFYFKVLFHSNQLLSDDNVTMEQIKIYDYKHVDSELATKTLLILNNLGQSYREISKLKHAYSVFRYAVGRFGHMQKTLRENVNANGNDGSVIKTWLEKRKADHKEHLKDLLTWAVSLEDTPDDSYFREQPIGQMDELQIWSLTNMFAIQGLGCYWKDYELAEELMRLSLPTCIQERSLMIKKYHEGSSADETIRLGRVEKTQDFGRLCNHDICMQFKSFSHKTVPDSIYDPYTYSLLRYVPSAASQVVPSHIIDTVNRELESRGISGVEIQSASVGDVNVCQSREVCKMCMSRPVEIAPPIPFIQNAEKSVRHVHIGYLSYDWRDHPMGRLTQYLVTHHNKENRHQHGSFDTSTVIFDVTLISYGPSDNTDIKKYIDAKVRSASANAQFGFIHFMDVYQNRNDRDVSNRIAQLELDILIDLTTHTYNGRMDLAGLKPANLIINYLGYPGTTGCKAFDYSMVDTRVVPPELALGFTEKLVYLPYNYQSTSMPLTVSPCWERNQAVGDGIASHRAVTCRQRMVRTMAPTVADNTAGGMETAAPGLEHSQVHPHEALLLDPESLLICSFNAAKKFEPLSFNTWMNVLHRVPKAILILLELEDATFAKPNLVQQLKHHGIYTSSDPRYEATLNDRVIFLNKRGWEDHLFRAGTCDVVLDNFVYGAHTTGSDMMWMGIPVVSLESWGNSRMPSRVAGAITTSLLECVGESCGGGVNSSPEVRLPHNEDNRNVLVVQTVRQYEDVVVRLLRVPKAIPESQVQLIEKLENVKAPGKNKYAALASQHNHLEAQPMRIIALHYHMLSRSLKQPTFDKYMLEKCIEYAYLSALELKHSSVPMRSDHHIVSVPRYVHQMQVLKLRSRTEPGLLVGPATNEYGLCDKAWRELKRYLNQEVGDIGTDRLNYMNALRIALFEASKELNAGMMEDSQDMEVIKGVVCRSRFSNCSYISSLVELLNADFSTPESAVKLEHIDNYCGSKDAIRNGDVVSEVFSFRHGSVESTSTPHRSIYPSANPIAKHVNVSFGKKYSVSLMEQLFWSDVFDNENRKSTLGQNDRVNTDRMDDDENPGGKVLSLLFGSDHGNPRMDHNRLLAMKEAIKWRYTSEAGCIDIPADAMLHMMSYEYSSSPMFADVLQDPVFASRYATLISTIAQLNQQDVRMFLFTQLREVLEQSLMHEVIQSLNSHGLDEVSQTVSSVCHPVEQFKHLIHALLVLQNHFVDKKMCPKAFEIMTDYSPILFEMYDGWPDAVLNDESIMSDTLQLLLHTQGSPFLAGNHFPFVLFSPLVKLLLQEAGPDDRFASFKVAIADDLDMLLNNHAVCHQRRERPIEACSFMLSAYVNHPTPIRLRYLGLILQQDIAEANQLGFQIASEAIMQQHIRDYRIHKQRGLLTVPMFVVKVPEVNTTEGSGPESAFVPLHFIFYCEEYGNAWWPRWGPSSVKTDKSGSGVGSGAGGSEEAVIYIAKELASLGHYVEVYADPNAEDHCQRMHFSNSDSTSHFCSCAHTDNVCYFHYSEFDALGETEIEYAEASEVVQVPSAIGDTTESVVIRRRTNPSKRPIRNKQSINEFVNANGELVIETTSSELSEGSVFVAWRYPLSLHLGKYRSSTIKTNIQKISNSNIDIVTTVSKHILLWVHDLLPHIALPSLLATTYDKTNWINEHNQNCQEIFYRDEYVFKIYVQSIFHKIQLPYEYLFNKIVILKNGVSDALMSHAKDEVGLEAGAVGGLDGSEMLFNDNSKFIYGSAPNRGLEGVLKIWSFIKYVIPDAELHVFYGFGKTLDERMKRLATGSITSTESETGEAGSRNSQDINVAKWDSMLNASANVQVTPEILTLPSQQEFDEWRSAVIDLLMQPDRGIKYHGSVDHTTLAKSFYQAGYLLYPTSFSETGCITCIKAMLSGCIPITSKYQQSVLGKYTDPAPVDLSTPSTDPGLTGIYDMGPEVAWNDLYHSYTELEFYQLVLFNDRVLYALGILNDEALMQQMMSWETGDGGIKSGEQSLEAKQKVENVKNALYEQLESYKATREVYVQLLKIPAFMNMIQHCISHYNYINNNVIDDIHVDMKLSRYDRWLYLHYLPSILEAHSSSRSLNLDVFRKNMILNMKPLYNWHSSAALLIDSLN